jgi:hypothetical protein
MKAWQEAGTVANELTVMTTSVVWPINATDHLVAGKQSAARSAPRQTQTGGRGTPDIPQRSKPAQSPLSKLLKTRKDDTPVTSLAMIMPLRSVNIAWPST